MTAASGKVDFKREFKNFYHPGNQPEIVIVPTFRFLMFEGEGSTESVSFKKAIEALFTVSYKAKFWIRRNRRIDYGVMPLEGLWWADDPKVFTEADKDKWKWVLMIMQPPPVSGTAMQQALSEVRKKKEPEIPGKIAFRDFEEGLCVQMMHVGPFSEEHAKIMEMHSIIKKNGGCFDGKTQKHHEIYLSDFRKVAPNRMRTVLRQPFQRA